MNWLRKKLCKHFGHLEAPVADDVCPLFILPTQQWCCVRCGRVRWFHEGSK